MKKVNSYLEKLFLLKDNFHHHQVLISIIGFVFFLVFGTNMYSVFIEEYLEDYKDNFKNKVLIKVRQNKNLFGPLYSSNK